MIQLKNNCNGKMIRIDGSYLEGGGQIMRTALSLAAITGKKFKINKIREGRPEPGIKEQHLQSIKLLSRICRGQENVSFGDKEFEFKPGKIENEKFKAEIKTAGSTALLLNTVMPLTFEKSLQVEVKGGGTWNKFAPPLLYLKRVLLPLLRKFGLEAEIKVEKEGFYPKGGAKLRFIGKKWEANKEIKLTDFNKPEKINIWSIATNHLKKPKVADRQANEAEKIIKEKENVAINKNIRYVEARCPGSGLLVCDNNLLVSDSLGEKGKSSEKVAREAASNYLNGVKNKARIDKYGADQLMVWMALASQNTGKDSKIKTSKISKHAKTNAYVIEKFLPVKFEFNKKIIIFLKK